MRQKELYDGREVPAIWIGGSLGTSRLDAGDYSKQFQVWCDGMMFGCSAIDTAENYGNGFSEKLVGEAVRWVGRETVFVASKVAPEHCRKEDVISACDKTLKRMKLDYINLYQIHWFNPTVPLEETLDAMQTLSRQGKIKRIGVCNFTLDQIKKTYYELGGKLATVQCEYNLTNRSVERDILPYCEENGIVFLAYTPLNKGMVAHPVLVEIAKKYKLTVSQVALNWLTMHPSVCAIPFTTKYGHMLENAQSTEFPLEEEDYHIIASEFDNPIVMLKPSQITCEGATSGVGNAYPAYQTIEEARENRHNLFPSPLDIAKEVNESMVLSKPIHVRKLADGRYQLVSGGVRYWGWVLTFGMDEEIECIVERNK